MSLLEIHTINHKLIGWRKNNIDIVFTNGCFDLLHRGHIDLLNQASSYGDILIVGLNSDSSVKKLKGASRPVEDEMIRSQKLMALNYIDHVVIFKQLTPRKLISELKPDVLVKGGDYD